MVFHRPKLFRTSSNPVLSDSNSTKAHPIALQHGHNDPFMSQFSSGENGPQPNQENYDGHSLKSKFSWTFGPRKREKLNNLPKESRSTRTSEHTHPLLRIATHGRARANSNVDVWRSVDQHSPKDPSPLAGGGSGSHSSRSSIRSITRKPTLLSTATYSSDNVATPQKKTRPSKTLSSKASSRSLTALRSAQASDAIVSVTFQMTPLTPTTPNTKPPSQPTASVRSSSAKDKSGRQRTCSAPLPPLESHGCRGATNSSGRHAYSSPIESGPHLRGELRELLGADFGYQVHYTRSRIMALQREQEYLTNLLNKLPITDTELMLNACDLPGDNDAADADAISLSHSIHSWNSSVASSSSSSPPTDNDRPYTTSQGPSRDSVYEAVLMDAPRVKAQQAYQDAIVALREADRELCYWLQQFLMITKENGCSLEYMLGMNDSIPSPALKIVRSNPEFTHNHPVSSSHAPTANAAVAAAAATTTARRRSHLRSFSVVEQQHQQQYDNVLQQQNQPSPTFSNCTLASSNDISRHSRNLEELCGSGTSATVTSTSINRPDPAKRLSNTGDDGSFGSRPDKVSAQPNERPYHGPVQLPPIEPHASILDAFATPFWGGDSPLSKQDEGSHGSGNASGQHHRRLDLTLTSPSPTSAAPPATTSSRKPTNPPYAFLSAPLPALQPSRPHASYPARDGSSSDVQTGASNANPPSPPPSPHRKQHARTTSLAVPSSVVQDKPKTPKGVSVQTNNDKTIPSTTTTGPLSSTPSLTPLPTPSVSANNNNNNSDKECRSREYDDVELLLYIGDHLESVSKAQRLVEKINQEMMVANHRYAQFRKAQQNYRRARRVPRHIRVEETF